MKKPNMYAEFFSDIRVAWEAGSEPRDAFWYLNNHFITAREYLLLEQYPENE